MMGDFQKGRKPLVRAHVQPQREPALFQTTGGVKYYLHKCGLYDAQDSEENFTPSRRYRNLSDNMSNLQNSFSGSGIGGSRSNAGGKSPKVLARFTSGPECVADLSRCCPSYCSSSMSGRSGLGASGLNRSNTSFNRNANRNNNSRSSLFIGTPSMLDAKSGSQLGSRQRPVIF